MDDARRAVAAALMKQERNGYANLVLGHALEGFTGSGRDRAFLSAVFYGTVERMVTLDHILQKFLQKPLAKLDAAVRAILRSGLYQARYMDGVPVHAAISEAVTLTRHMGKTSAAGLVNAVLRRAAVYDLEKETFADETQRLCVQYSVSPQVAQLFCSRCGELAEETLRASFAPPGLCVRVNTLRTTLSQVEEAFAKQGVRTRRGHVPQSLYVDYKGDITASKLFKRGLLHVQGEASQLACAALAPSPGEKVLDLCAAPGGKSATLAQYMEDRGVLLARDAAETRVPLIGEALERLGVTCAAAAQGDAAVFDPALAGADAVLCDVPCSGLGVLAKKPDIRFKTLEGLGALEALQRDILETAARYVKPGGRLVYSTCTLNPGENEGVVEPFLAAHPEFRAQETPFAPPGVQARGALVTLWPSRTGTDGFFVASLVRAGSGAGSA